MSNNPEVDWNTIPVPQDDGGCEHLTGMSMPSLSLQSTSGQRVNLSGESGLVVIYAYPMTGIPGIAPPDGWDMIPGARGCTPQSCSFRDHAQELAQLGVDKVYGVSSQSNVDQAEAATRLKLPFELLSDEQHELADAMRLPEFTVEGRRLLKRLALVVRGGVVVKVFYPVFPPDRNASMVIEWLREQ
ncbi:MAG: peroxiredoxin [Granulosicoccus sp.]|nr:peroxiredoxin [Granulosicoccus sp.]